MRKSFLLLVAFMFWVGAKAQQNTTQGQKPQPSFNYPVLVKLIQGQGNVFRIGFVRTKDFGIPESDNIYGDFMKMATETNKDFKNKCFVYFPLSREGGEMLIINKSDVARMDMTYEEAMNLIVPEN